MPAPSIRLIALPLALVVTFLTGCGSSSQDISVNPTKEAKYDEASSAVFRSSARCLAPPSALLDDAPETCSQRPSIAPLRHAESVEDREVIQRVARDVRKVGDAVRAETVRKAAFVIAVSKIPTVRAGEKARVVIGDAISVSGTGSVNGYPCGGDLPSCCTLRAESGGIPTAQNPTSSSSGLWQFTHDTWAGYGGYSEAKYAPPEVQNERARIVFAGGRGASNWYGDNCYPGG